MQSNQLAPIVLFVYNRLWHTQETINALKKNSLALESELFIYADGAKNEKDSHQVLQVRNYIKGIDGFKKVTIIERDINLGLADSIITGVSKIVDKFDKIIVLEDDLVTSPLFLRFMNDALELYERDNEVASIHGYQYPLKDSQNLPDTFFIKGADCWGWATWSRGWNLFEPNAKKLLNDLHSKGLQKELDFNNSYGYTRMLKNQIDGKVNSWAIRWYVSCFLKRKLTLYPKQSYVQNIGNDDSGTHSTQTDDFFIENLSQELLSLNKLVVFSEDLQAKKSMERYFKSIKLNLFNKVFNKLRRVFLIKKLLKKT